MTIWITSTMFILAFLGFVVVVFLIFLLWLAHEYNISISIKAKREDQEDTDLYNAYHWSIGEGDWSDETNWWKPKQTNDSDT